MGTPTRQLRELALFAGAGGGIWGSRLLGWRTVGYVEIDEYCQRVLRARIQDGLFDDAPIWDDIKTFDGKPWRGHVEVLTAGFPCQPFSVAGKRRGENDPRNMWPDTLRILTEIRPQAALLENVPGLLTGSHGYFGRILGDLVEGGFNARWCVLGADDVGAPHRRKRLWVLAYPESTRYSKQNSGNPRKTIRVVCGCSQQTPVANGVRHRLQGIEQEGTAPGSTVGSGGNWWAVEPPLGRVAHGVANRVNRIRALGNGQVPAVFARAWKVLNG